ncbi:MAG: FAD-binding oxidoreductase [Paracoccus sp. (in: a-proteobacteria)]|uniref:FAD-binding oxidoreductase n=1 Tax=Paracoccus sp. TaxID=267 RepID=UPI0026DFD8F8|nr:FAD-binding oxidoreductase [Paracoccus sp. (in: a-proteobacteria)]MDO5613878.1 FAD-binding oxidoreductase [Paracoccus sp. (in: a-proteobacteria)]
MTDPFMALLGPSGWRPAGSDMTGFSRDWLDRYGDAPIGIALPASTAEVAQVVALCAAQRISVTPQGGNTGLNGGSVLSPGQRGIILSLARMNRVHSIDPVGMTVTVDAGVVLQALHDAVAPHGLMFPLHLGSEGSAQIGGLIATNAGGSLAMRYGMMDAQVLGLEAVLPDGRIWDGMRALIKDNTGLQLRRLFCGAEGRLGVVTRAILRLEPAPKAFATALLALSDLDAALHLGARARAEAGDRLMAMEFFSETGLEMLLHHMPQMLRPTEAHGPFYVLLELAAPRASDNPGEVLEGLLETAITAGEVLDGTIAASGVQRRALWQLREEIPEGQRREGPQIKHDVAVPVASLTSFIAAAQSRLARILPGVRINPFGHLGDGNVHLNLSPPKGRGFGGTEAALSAEVYDLATAMGGTFSAEHGLGQTKVALANRLRSETERRLMADLIHAVDPGGVMNPGKLI